MNIFNYFQKKGINTIDASFYRKVEEWKSWYNGNVRNFSYYRVYSGQGTYTRRKRKSLGMAKKLSEDIADLLLNERVKITLSDERTGDFVTQVLESNNFLVLGNEYQERKAYTGTVAYVPYLTDVNMMDDGTIISGRIKINYISASNIYPVSWSNGKIKECIFTFVHTVNRKKYVQIQFHKLEGEQYVIENTVLGISEGSREGRELTTQEWKALKPFKELIPRVETGSLEPQFVIDRLNIVNDADYDESNPMGIAIFANSLDVLKKIDTEFDSYSNEFELGKKRIFVAPEMVRNKDGSPAFDPEDTVFYKLPDEYAEKKDGKSIIDINMQIRTEEHSKAINDDLNYLSLKCGFGTNKYRFENGNVKTATEVISENSDMYRMIQKHEIILNDAIQQLVRIIIWLGIAIGEPLSREAEVTIDFDDSIIEDKKAERDRDRQDVSMGAMALFEYRAKWYGETPEQAKANVGQTAEVIE